MIANDLKLVFILLATLLAETFAEARQIRSTRSCPQGCLTCSVYNGCFSCKPHYYFLLYRSGMKQIGVCTHACPTGYYQNRANDYFRCSRCHVPNCGTCFDKYFCAFCEPPYYSHQGRCVLTCPTDMYADTLTGECKALVDCTVGTWTEWGDCSKNGRTCGYKYGTELRVREVIDHPTPGGHPCPELSEERKCRMSVRHCPGQEQKSSNRKPNRKQNKSRDKQRTEQPVSSARTSTARRRRKKKRKLSPTANEVESHL